MARVGQPKAESARAADARDQPRGARSSRCSERADAARLDALVAAADVVIDCSDNFATRHAVNAACVRARASRWCRARRSASTARSRVYDTRDAGVALLRLPVPARRRRSRKSRCATMGVFAPLVGIIGTHAGGRGAEAAGRRRHARWPAGCRCSTRARWNGPRSASRASPPARSARRG